MKVMFFARLRELHGDDALVLADAEAPATVAALRACICAGDNTALAEAMADPNVFCAVNQKVVSESHALCSSDEIAFFPPMTGG